MSAAFYIAFLKRSEASMPRPAAEVLEYEQDYYAWARRQARALRAARPNSVDWKNLAEEIEDLGRAEREAVRSQLIRVIEHLLKLQYSAAAPPRLGWRVSVNDARRILADKLTRTLRRDVAERLPDLWAHARETAALRLVEHGGRSAAEALPEACPYALDQLLGPWLPANVHGLEDDWPPR